MTERGVAICIPPVVRRLHFGRRLAVVAGAGFLVGALSCPIALDYAERYHTRNPVWALSAGAILVGILWVAWMSSFNSRGRGDGFTPTQGFPLVVNSMVVLALVLLAATWNPAMAEYRRYSYGGLFALIFSLEVNWHLPFLANVLVCGGLALGLAGLRPDCLPQFVRDPAGLPRLPRRRAFETGEATHA